nr:RNA-directed DNA polymerase, eukaryota [Tanacetum cinerariifolium]
MKVVQAYDANNNELPIPLLQAPIAPPTILPPSPVLSLSPMFDSQDFLPPEEIPPKDTKTSESPTLIIPRPLGGEPDSKEPNEMPPKRTSTSEAPAMTQYDIKKLVADSVFTALEAQAANMQLYRELQSEICYWLLTNKYCPRTEVKKMEDEFYNLVVKGNDLKTYIRRFQELATLCPTMVPNFEKRMEVFIEGLPRIENVDRLVGNLCTLWISRIHLHVNVVRFERSPIHCLRLTNPISSDNTGAPSFASALKCNPNISLPISSTPAMVLDDSCVVKRDLDIMLWGKLSNSLQLTIYHVGVTSWFSRLCNAQSDFVSREQIVWVDIKGVTLHAWSHSTFNKIGYRWGEEDNILEKFKIIIHGKIFMLRAKELIVWSSVFKDVAEVVYCSDDESIMGADENNVETSKKVNLDAESDVKGVSETYFGEHDDNLGNDQDPIQPLNEKETSNDPFNICDLLKKHDKGEGNSGLDTSFPYPPVFTPEKDNLNIDVQEVKGTDQAKSQSRSEGLCLRILEETQSLDEHLSSEIRVNGHEQKGGSILEVLDYMIKAKKEWVRELNIKHKVNLLTLQETKMDSISAMDVKLLCDNYNFNHVFSEVIGNSGGILCTWDSNVFHKEQHIISDNFVALYGTWNPNKAKLLMISIYAPQSATGKRSLWSYITSFITRWNGDCMVFGDFNEVRCMEDRMGSVFNVQRDNEFNNFISNSELVKVHLEGYSFTWSHLLATKMSKLDRFLVTE